jgi:K+-transporting ATPase ATPase C chain
MSEDEVRGLAQAHTSGRQFGFLGEPVVNVLELNLDLDSKRPRPAAASAAPAQ